MVSKQGVCGEGVSLMDLSNLFNFELGFLSILFVHWKSLILFVVHVLGSLIFGDLNFSLT